LKGGTKKMNTTISSPSYQILARKKGEVKVSQLSFGGRETTLQHPFHVIAQSENIDEIKVKFESMSRDKDFDYSLINCETWEVIDS
jgi:hypothetical protein